jgi:hypothetical protein
VNWINSSTRPTQKEALRTNLFHRLMVIALEDVANIALLPRLDVLLEKLLVKVQTQAQGLRKLSDYCVHLKKVAFVHIFVLHISAKLRVRSVFLIQDWRHCDPCILNWHPCGFRRRRLNLLRFCVENSFNFERAVGVAFQIAHSTERLSIRILRSSDPVMILFDALGNSKLLFRLNT